MPNEKGKAKRKPKPRGVGSILCRMLGCGGFRHAEDLNKWGPDECLEHMDQIIEWVHEPKKNATISVESAKRLVLLAIEKARQT